MENPAPYLRDLKRKIRTNDRSIRTIVPKKKAKAVSDFIDTLIIKQSLFELEFVDSSKIVAKNPNAPWNCVF